ncbi:hypothetical protein [Erythrobacter sp.]|jgi:hypothetical protein|uniref:hypothetical protein n=1 Tax=Erythrobacter sp. TaxID=1042 RepID=UPI002EA692F5|nr:hypothetical protein [Erythrobacter sp.]
MELMKAMVLGAILTGCVALVIGSQGSSGGQLHIHLMAVGPHALYWSWPLFLAGTGLGWALLLLQR